MIVSRIVAARGILEFALGLPVLSYEFKSGSLLRYGDGEADPAGASSRSPQFDVRLLRADSDVAEITAVGAYSGPRIIFARLAKSSPGLRRASSLDLCGLLFVLRHVTLQVARARVGRGETTNCAMCTCGSARLNAALLAL